MSPLSDRRVPWVLAALHVALGLQAVAADRFLHDEGLLTELFAALVGRDFLPAFFMQKVRPPIALLYAPAAALGHTAFAWMHVLVAGLAVPLIAAAARRLGIQAPNVAAAVVALSPMLLAGGAAGVSNSDAVTGLCLVSWAVAARRFALAGVIMGALVWVRSELAVVAVALAIVAVADERPRALAGLVAWPLAYGLAGALYHGDVLWLLHYPPSLPEPMPGNPFWAERERVADLPELAAAVLSISPLCVLVPLASLRAMTRAEVVLGASGLVLLALLVILPRWQVFNFDPSPRYLMPVLPFVALAVARVAEAGWRGNPQGTAWLLVWGLLVVAAHRLGGPAFGPWSVAIVALAVAAARSGRPVVARVLALGLAGVGPGVHVAGARLDRESELPHLDEVVARLRERGSELDQRPIVTNAPALAAYLSRSGALPRARVFYLVQADQAYEIDTLTNPHNGQRAAIRAALAEGFYGTPIFPEAIHPDALPERALLVLTRDPRLDLVMPPATWAARLHVLHPGRDAIVAEVRPAPRRPR